MTNQESTLTFNSIWSHDLVDMIRKRAQKEFAQKSGGYDGIMTGGMYQDIRDLCDFVESTLPPRIFKVTRTWEVMARDEDMARRLAVPGKLQHDIEVEAL